MFCILFHFFRNKCDVLKNVTFYFIFKYVCIHVSMCEFMHIICTQRPEGVRSFRAGVTSGCAPPITDAGNQT